jgi:hypothetical protein
MRIGMVQTSLVEQKTKTDEPDARESTSVAEPVAGLFLYVIFDLAPIHAQRLSSTSLR